MKGSHPAINCFRISPLDIPTIFPSRDDKASFVSFLSSLAFTGGGIVSGITSPVVAFIAANPPPPVLPQTSQNFAHFSGPRTDSMASKPSLDSRSRYPCARNEIELSLSKIWKGIEARSSDCASSKDERPAPEMRIGFLVAAMFDVVGSILKLQARLEHLVMANHYLAPLDEAVDI